MNLVLDANVILKAYIPEVYSEKAEKLFNNIAREGISLVEPDLIYPETGSILWKKFRLKELTVSEVEEISGEILQIAFIIVPSKSVFQLAVDFSLAFDITVYDAMYLSAAKIFESRLITADKKLIVKLKNTELRNSIEWLGDI